ncbi:BLUF domain-containing protein [Aquimarina sp. U1-2]|uniref:BLUF domain-containing protein n=1 Tax=Aquimarina sp. U1-2 TaxID=2823141 RepID=UPI001AECB034|nr:BLUF domain-containing protein [Aquimarina sp. U1-2]MBP2832453.1 BLUF domain-containing protein [Aquimarina sp. U1-2]
MLHVERKDELEQLRQMSNFFNAKFDKRYNSARLDFDNEHGKGYIATYKMFPGLVAKTYNVKLTREFKFTKKEKGIAPTYFIYCVKGHYMHKFYGEQSYKKIYTNQNVILSGGLDKGHEIVFPPEIDLQISLIFLSPEKFRKVHHKKAKRIEVAMQDLAKVFTLDKKEKYFGEIDPGTAEFSRLLIENKRLDTLGVIITEGAILNTLGSQLTNHEKRKTEKSSALLSNDNLDKILQLGEYIKEHIYRKIKIEELAEKSGIYPKKLQKGFNALFGESIANLIQRLRMEKAKELLQSTELSISEISYSVGISSLSYFSRLFQEHYGVLPSNYRANVDTSSLIFELSYRSKANSQLQNSDIEAILDTSRNHNAQHQITGALIHFKGEFFQLLEGNKEVVLQLFKKIRADKRHYDVKLVYTGLKPSRIFNDWSMAYLDNKYIIPPNGAVGSLSTSHLDRIMDGLEDQEILSDILWRRILTLLNTPAA